jgi:peptidoglycan/LPS O-acetylase OafA/YrhL
VESATSAPPDTAQRLSASAGDDAALLDVDDVQRGDADPPASSPGGIDLPFRPDVEGLRAVAVVLVVLYHAGVSTFAGGYVGVDVFFVISGYLITGLLLREHEKRRKISIPGFYARRARRILPAAMVVIVATLLISHHIQNPIAYEQYDDEAKWATMFLANFHFAYENTSYFLQGSLSPSPFLHFWSLAVEEQFYVVWPTVVIVAGLIFRRFPLRHVVLIVAVAGSVASFIYSVHLTDTNLIWSYYSPFSRAWELGVGAIAATLARPSMRIPRRLGLVVAWAGIGAIAYGALTYSALTPYPGTYALAPVLGAAAVVVGGASGLGAGHLLTLRPVRSVGRVSYGWYLLHYPPMILFTGVLWSQPLSVHERLLIGVVTLGLAYAMYYVLERPIRRSKFLSRHPWWSIAMGLAFVAGAFIFATQFQVPGF